MAYIKLRDSTQVKLSPDRAKKVNDMFNDAKVPNEQKISIDGRSFTKSMIAFIQVHDEEDASEIRKSDAATRMQQLVRKQHDEFEDMLALTPEKRSMLADFFSFYFFTLTGRVPNDSEIEEARKLQLKYYREFDYVYPHPKIFHDLIMASNPEKEIGGYQKELSGTIGQLFILGAKYVRSSEYMKSKA